MLENGSIKGNLLNENVLSTLHRGCERQNAFTLIYFLTPVTKVVGVGTAEGEENRERQLLTTTEQQTKQEPWIFLFFIFIDSWLRSVDMTERYVVY